MQFIKRSSEYFLFFVDWFNNHTGCGSSSSDGGDRVRSTKILSDLFKNLGGGQGHVQFVEKQNWKERKG